MVNIIFNDNEIKCSKVELNFVCILWKNIILLKICYIVYLLNLLIVIMAEAFNTSESFNQSKESKNLRILAYSVKTAIKSNLINQNDEQPIMDCWIDVEVMLL